MNKEQIFNELTKNVIIHSDQGYAFYAKINDLEIEATNGVVKEVGSNKITFDTNFRLASVSKQFIAFAIVDLILKNKLDFTTTIKEIYPSLPDYFNEITIRNLLNHTSGIYNYEDIVHDDWNRQILDRDILTFLEKTDGTYFEIGSKYQYSNTAYILLGLIVEDISKQDITSYIKENIFDKANMENSFVNIEGYTNITNRAYGHIIEDKKLVVKDQSWTSATIGDGGLYSSVNELKEWIKFLINSKHSTHMFKPNVITNISNTSYGLGIRIVDDMPFEIIYHCGDTIGTNTLVLFTKNLSIMIIFLTNINKIDTGIIKNNLFNLLHKGELNYEKK